MRTQLDTTGPIFRLRSSIKMVKKYNCSWIPAVVRSTAWCCFPRIPIFRALTNPVCTDFPLESRHKGQLWGLCLVTLPGVTHFTHWTCPAWVFVWKFSLDGTKVWMDGSRNIPQVFGKLFVLQLIIRGNSSHALSLNLRAQQPQNLVPVKIPVGCFTEIRGKLLL